MHYFKFGVSVLVLLFAPYLFSEGAVTENGIDSVSISNASPNDGSGEFEVEGVDATAKTIRSAAFYWDNLKWRHCENVSTTLTIYSDGRWNSTAVIENTSGHRNIRMKLTAKFFYRTGQKIPLNDKQVKAILANTRLSSGKRPPKTHVTHGDSEAIRDNFNTIVEEGRKFDSEGRGPHVLTMGCKRTN